MPATQSMNDVWWYSGAIGKMRKKGIKGDLLLGGFILGRFGRMDCHKTAKKRNFTVKILLLTKSLKKVHFLLCWQKQAQNFLFGT
jgi:hypothetical protein